MNFPNPDDYSDWKPYIRALLSGLTQGGLASLIADDPMSGAILAGSGVGGGGGVAAGFSPVWLSDDDANLYLGNTTIPPTAGPLFNVDTTNLADAAITFQKIADDAVATQHIQDLAITNGLIANATILSAKIGDAQIVEAKIADLAVNTGKIANLAVSSAKIANLAVGTAQIDDLAVTTAKIGLLQVTNALIANATISGAKIANATITTALIANAQITQALMANAAIGTAQIIDLSVSSAKIALLAVGSAQIASAAITTAKIDDLAVTQIKVGDYVINEQKLEEFAVNAVSLISSTSAATISVSGFSNLVLGGVTMEVDVDVPNIVGDQVVLVFLTIKASAAAATEAEVRVERDGVNGLTIPAAARFPVPAAITHHTYMFLDSNPTAGSTHTYTVQARRSGAGNWSADDVALVADLMKR